MNRIVNENQTANVNENADYEKKTSLLHNKTTSDSIYKTIVPVAQSDRVLASEANVELTQATEKQSLINSDNSDTPKNTPNRSQISPDLQLIIDAWLKLPDHIKAAIKALIQTHNMEAK